MKQRILLTTFLLALLLPLLLPVTAEAARDQDVIKAAGQLASEFKSKIMKDAIAKAHEQLWSPDPSQYNDAVLFFAELRAKPMLFAMLNSRLIGQKFGFGKTDLTFLVDIVETGNDVLQICQGMLANAERILESGGPEGRFARREFLKHLGAAIARIAGVDLSPPAKYDRGTLNHWVISALQKGLSLEKSEEEKNRLRFALQSLDPQGDYHEKQTTPVEKPESVAREDTRLLLPGLIIAGVVLAGIVIILLLRRK